MTVSGLLTGVGKNDIKIRILRGEIMVINKRLDCTFEDLDSVVVALAKEIEDGWHIVKLENHGFTCSPFIKRDEPEFSIELARKRDC